MSWIQRTVTAQRGSRLALMRMLATSSLQCKPATVLTTRLAATRLQPYLGRNMATWAGSLPESDSGASNSSSSRNNKVQDTILGTAIIAGSFAVLYFLWERKELGVGKNLQEFERRAELAKRDLQKGATAASQELQTGATAASQEFRKGVQHLETAMKSLWQD